MNTDIFDLFILWDVAFNRLSVSESINENTESHRKI